MSAARHRLVVDTVGKPHTSNDERQKHRMVTAKAHKAWREGAAELAMATRFPRRLPPCRVHAYARYPGGVLPDIGAIAPTVKCIIDGLVDYGCWPDDTPTWVVSEVYGPPERVPGEPYAVVVILEEVSPDDPPPPR